MVERGPEKAGVGGSIPSLATIQVNYLRQISETSRYAHLEPSRVRGPQASIFLASRAAIVAGASFIIAACAALMARVHATVVFRS